MPNGTVIQGGTIVADATIEERSDDESVITENPVENGSVTNDHAYDLPQKLEITYVWANNILRIGQSSFLNSMYQKLLTLKQGKVLLSVVTGKRSYQGMLIKGLSVTTDKDTENVLLVRISLQQLLLTSTKAVTIASAAQQSQPQNTMPTSNSGTVSLQPAPNFNSGTPAGA